ncbi:CdiA family toxin C-terminal domain-containing protein, partial [Paenibacillus polymyxa]
KEQEKARAEAALKAEKEAAPPELTEEDYEKIWQDYRRNIYTEDRRPKLKPGSYRGEDGVVRTRDGKPDVQYYSEWKHNYPEDDDFFMQTRKQDITEEEKKWMFYAISIENPLMVGGRGGMDNTKELEGILSKLGRGKGFFNISSGVSAKVRVQELLARQQIEATENVASQKINQTLETKGYKPQPNERLTTRNQYKQQDQQARKTLRETASKAAREENSQIQKKVIYNVTKSTNTRKASNIKEYLKKEKEIVKSQLPETEGTGNLKYKEGYHIEHLTGEVKKCTDWKGVSGGHNYEEFKKFFDINGKYGYEEVGRTNHPDISGISDIEYRLKVEVKNYQGKRTGEYKVIPKEDKPPLKKTIYDPNVISSDDIVRLGKEAMEEGIKSQRVNQLKSQANKQIIRGVSSNGLKFEGIKNIDTGEIENFYPVLKFGEN